MSIFQPMFLIAVPQLLDPSFKRSVVLLLQHNKEGAFGLILNQKTHFNLKEFSESQKIFCHPRLYAQPVFKGGPVEPYRGFVLHRNFSLPEKQDLFSNVYVSGTTESLQLLMSSQDDDFRFILGYAGWSAAQLESELAAGSWIAALADEKYLFSIAADDMWDAILHDMGVDPASLAQGMGVH